MQRTDGSTPKRVAVIGAGAAGLCTLRHFSGNPNYRVTAFEQQDRIGGIWNYPEGCEEQPEAPDSSPLYCRVYRDLRINSPRVLTHLRDLPLPAGSDTYVHRTVVRNYLTHYTSHFKLLPYIKFRHRVISVTPVNINTDIKWRLLVQDTANQTFADTLFDVLFICNGHFNKPYLPDVPEIKVYQGPVIHSSAYRTPEPYRNKVVLMVGAGSSGNDIACELMHVAKTVIIKQKVAARKFPDRFVNVQEVSHLKSTEKGVVFPNGTKTKIDAVILCTGYQFDFPFLTPDCGLEISRGRVAPLYRHMISCVYPTMMFIGLLSHTPFFGAGTEDQVLFCKAYIDGKVKLPSREDMIADCDRDYRERLAEGILPHKAHMMRKKLWPYCRQLAEEAGFQPHDPVMEKINAASNQNIVWTPYDFRNYKIEKVDADTFVCEHL
ncbi:Flavin-containing monooxygenase FMO GS-OX3 [Hypsibius exemplaris]|uniref:Flavin-containing monooxygenase n=1 Tax=Hypsibius exemplaris TaxID=2072580 RepID=A0A9X6RN15_HYPEX|nr:Flavin-containing monooxygenase FMO GS-OX3 [Hypsibius exemplaris]